MINKTLFIVLSVLLCSVSCKKTVEPNNFTFSGLGTVLSVIYTGEKSGNIEELLKKDIEVVENDFSYYKKESFVSVLNREGHLKDFEVPHHVCELIKSALQYGKDTDGVFDITYKSESVLWDGNSEPDQEQINEKKKMSGYERVVADCEKNTVRFKNEGIKIDLGGIAKGYAIDRAGRILKENGKDDFIINYGGDMLVCGKKGKDPWKIGIKDPEDQSSYLKMLNFSGNDCTGVATSGDYERFFVINNKSYSHIFDPRSGRPVINARSVTVVAKNATIADVTATAVSVAISEKELIKKIMEKFDVKIYTLSGPDMKWIEW